MGYTVQKEFKRFSAEYIFIWNFDSYHELENVKWLGEDEFINSVLDIKADDLFGFLKNIFNRLDNGYLWIVKIKMPSGITYGYYKEIDTQQTADDLYNHFVDIFGGNNNE